MPRKNVNVPGLGRLPAFSHATIAGDFIFVAGTLGVAEDGLAVVDGGTGPETEQALKHIERILAECGASLADIVKVNVYLTDMTRFPEMNRAYMAAMGKDPPARITVGCHELALGAMVEIDCVAYLPAGRA
jgi:2-iminobutanoate/2-iminopropanoate deaminase